VEVGPTLGYVVKLDARITRNPYYRPAGQEYPLFPENARRSQESLVGSIGVQANYWHGRQASLRVRYEADTGWTSGIDTSSSHVYGLLALDLSK
jgi:hypothetical protein